MILRLFSSVQLTGLEPEPTYVDMNLNHARMPIPPQLQLYLSLISDYIILPYKDKKCKRKFKKIKIF